MLTVHRTASRPLVGDTLSGVVSKPNGSDTTHRRLSTVPIRKPTIRKVPEAAARPERERSLDPRGSYVAPSPFSAASEKLLKHALSH